MIKEAKRLREDLKSINDKIDNSLKTVSLDASKSISSIEDRANTSQFMRLLVLVINIICLHLIVRFYKESQLQRSF